MTVIRKAFSEDMIFDIVSEIRTMMRKESRRILESAMLECKCAVDWNSATHNLTEIARAAANGKVSKLFIAEDQQVWGKYNGKSGHLELSPCQLDHQDDDVLDDIAQTVLRKGGQVIITKIEDLPKRRPALAIIKSNSELSLITSQPKDRTSLDRELSAA